VRMRVERCCFKQMRRSDELDLISTSHSFGIYLFGTIDGKMGWGS
jgi:hypothetical protein